MKRITVEVEDELHKKIKFRTLSLDKTTKNYVLDLIKKDLETKKDIHL